ncbi:DUF5667 domain-containing protein [Chloroflexota bacterium]
MRTISILLLFCTLALMFCFPRVVYAQGENEELSDPGITPDSPLYFADKWSKQLSLMFTFRQEAKVGKALKYAEERLAEAQVMAIRNRIREEERATLGYGEFLAIAIEKMEETSNEGISNNISELVALATTKHLSALDEIRDLVPNESKEAISRAREASMNGQQNALRILARERLGKAIKINLDTVENRLNRAREKSAESNIEEVEKALDDTDRMLRFREELSENAKRLGQDTTIVEQLVAKATSKHIDVLAEVYEKMPEQNRVAIQNTITNTMINRETAVEALKNRGALGEISEETSLPERIRQEIEVRERVRERASSSGNGTLERERLENQLEEQARTRTSVNTENSENTPKVDKNDTTKQGADSGERLENQLEEQVRERNTDNSEDSANAPKDNESDDTGQGADSVKRARLK